MLLLASAENNIQQKTELGTAMLSLSSQAKINAMTPIACQFTFTETEKSPSFNTQIQSKRAAALRAFEKLSKLPCWELLASSLPTGSDDQNAEKCSWEI